MRTSRTLVFHGPNMWSDRVLEVWLEGGEVSPDRWQQGLVQIHHWVAGYKVNLPAGPTNPAEIVLRLTLAIQELAGDEAVTGWVDPRCSPAHPRFAVEFVEESVALHSLEIALRMVQAACGNGTFSFAEDMKQLRGHAFDIGLGRTTGAIVAAGAATGHSLHPPGCGESRPVRVRSAAAPHLCGRHHGHRLPGRVRSPRQVPHQAIAGAAGHPVPRGRLVDSDARAAWHAACQIGLPVVLKPRDADYGDGVSLRLDSREDVERAYQHAHRFSTSVLVEQMLMGDHHRLLVVGDRVIAALRREAAHVVGNGRQTIAELIAEGRPRPRGSPEDTSAPWFRIEIDQQTHDSLARQELRLESILAPGQSAVLAIDARALARRRHLRRDRRNLQRSGRHGRRCRARGGPGCGGRRSDRC